MNSFKVTVEGNEYSVQVRNYSPGRPAPFSRNPDDNAFSDPGDDPELDFIIIGEGGQDISDDIDAITYSDICDAVLEIIENREKERKQVEE